MAVFFAKTWFLWWAFAIVIITRWFHVAAADDPRKERASEPSIPRMPTGSQRWSSSLS
jgi:hypothetical protein